MQKQKSPVETDVKSIERRKVVKTVVGGVTATVAYNLLPAKWGTPLVKGVFLPAHAKMSSYVGTNGLSIMNLQVSDIAGDETTRTRTVRVSGYVNPPRAGIPVTVVATPVKS